MIIYTHPVAGNLPVKKQKNFDKSMHTFLYTSYK